MRQWPPGCVQAGNPARCDATKIRTKQNDRTAGNPSLENFIIRGSSIELRLELAKFAE